MTSLLRRSFFRFLLTVALCAATSLAMYSQSTTDGAIGGSVTDQHKGLVPNAKVTVRNTETNMEGNAVTDEAGGFRIVQLRPGPYVVTVEAQGFSPYKRENVVVEIGRVTFLDIPLTVGGVAATVEVRGEAPVVDASGQDFSTNLDQTSINELPINGRRWSNFALLTPGATPDGDFGLISFRGISGLLNNNTVDGGDNNQAFFSEERGRTRLSYVISQASISEFQVNTANYSAEYGRAAGGVVNAITKSGTNKFHGSAFYYIRDNALGATNPFSVQSVVVGGVSTKVPIKPEDRRHQFGGNIGGPIVTDKVFFFFSYDQQKRNFPGIGTTGDPQFLALTSEQQSTLTARGVTNTQRDAGLAFLQSLTGTVPRKGDQYIVLPKLDWHITPNNLFTATYDRLRWNSPAGVQTQPVVFRGRASFGDDFVNVDSVNVRLASTISSQLLNEARFQYGRDNEFEFSQPPAPGEPTTGPSGKPPQIEINPDSGGISIGKPDFLDRRAFPDEQRWQFADNVTLNHRKHIFKFGGEVNRVHDLEDNLFLGGGNFTYVALEDFLSDFANPRSCGGPLPAPLTPCYDEFDQGFGPPAFRFTTVDYSLFAQDDWRLAPRLTVNLGLRWEYEHLPKSQLPNPLAPQTSSFPSDKNNFGPRIGLAWAITSDGKTSLRGGYGIYYGRIINSTIANAITNTGVANGQLQIALGAGDAGAPVYPNVLSSSAGASASRDIVAFSPSMVNPLIHQADIIFEREILHNTVVSASYLFSRGLGLPTFVDINLPPPSSTITYKVVNGALDGQSFSMAFFPRSVRRPNPNFNRIMEIESTVRSLYNAFVLQLNRRLSGGLQFQTSYTLSKATDTGQASQTFTARSSLLLNPFDRSLEQGTSNFDIRHRYVLSLVWLPEFFKEKDHPTARAILNGFTIAPIVTVYSGSPFTGTVSGSAPGGLSFGINGSGGASRPPFIPRNASRFPARGTADLRISRRFKITESANLEFLAEAFNLPNHVNVTALQTGLYRISRSNPISNLIFNPLFGTPTAAGNTLFRERQIQFAARFAF